MIFGCQLFFWIHWWPQNNAPMHKIVAFRQFVLVGAALAQAISWKTMVKYYKLRGCIKIIIHSMCAQNVSALEICLLKILLDFLKLHIMCIESVQKKLCSNYCTQGLSNCLIYTTYMYITRSFSISDQGFLDLFNFFKNVHLKIDNGSRWSGLYLLVLIRGTY